MPDVHCYTGTTHWGLIPVGFYYVGWVNVIKYLCSYWFVLFVFFFKIHDRVFGHVFQWVWSGSVFGDVAVCLWMSHVFRAGIENLSGLLSCEVLLESKLLAALSAVVLSSIWLTVCATCFNILSMISPWSVSKSELDWGEIVLTKAGVLWFIGDRRQTFFF